MKITNATIIRDYALVGALTISALSLSIGMLFCLVRPIGESKIAKIERDRKEVEYNVFKERLFGPRGYSDTNQDGILSFEEKVNAWQKMGYTNRLYDSVHDCRAGDFRPGSLFPAPKSSQEMQRAIEFYEAELKSKMEGGRK